MSKFELLALSRRGLRKMSRALRDKTEVAGTIDLCVRDKTEVAEVAEVAGTIAALLTPKQREGTMAFTT